MKRAARLDANHHEIVRALEAVGARVQSLASVGSGCPDLVVGWRRRNILLEVKDGAKIPSKRRLTPDEERWHRTWSGQVAIVHNVTEALHAIGLDAHAGPFAHVVRALAEERERVGA